MGTDVERMTFVTEWVAGRLVHRRRDVALADVLAAIEADGEVLKASRKSVTRRVGGWIVKASAREGAWGMLKRAVRPARYRRGWLAAVFLAQRGLNVAAPVAFVETRWWGRLMGTAFVGEFLAGACDVEAFADGLIAQGVHPEDVHAYLRRIADSVNALTDAGVEHTDLAGKNILTRDGMTFYFIDLDGVALGRAYTRKRRMKNHVQLYDSFCDRWGDEFLEPFVRRMLAPGEDATAWLRQVRSLQQKRRARTVAAWKRQGRI